MKQYEIINLYRDGVSFRKIAQRLDVDRKTVSKICHRYQEGLEAVIHSQSEKELEEATHQVVSTHQYNTKNRTTRTFTPEVDQLMRAIYQQEKIKNKRLGSHKQALTAKASRVSSRRLSARRERISISVTPNSLSVRGMENRNRSI